MSDPTNFFLATFPGVGRALFSSVEAAQEWCDKRAEERFPGDVVKWAEPEDFDEAGVGTGQTGQRWHRQVPKTGHSVPSLSLGTVVSLPVDAES
ncbi:hypothetical protein [Actinacidiphila sp. ITFR-21]|uniref:hypothetical protein n=1 Tax=Actinacidiphila sp. ITFR-21 TaxID=3075199 RepID=UPI00288AE6CE|nr:hypothetical protein [Streptomyces sp. ITFR-21]WNI19992.1 hypothetical protein RLT57_31110 [Streptomyces sp. ITFR-21]